MLNYWPQVAGGMLIGASALMLLLVNGRVAGISGIVGRLLRGGDVGEPAAFLVGLLAGPVLYAATFGAFPATTIAAGWPVLVLAGLLVGFGARMGSGCTSGHGVVGLARLSPRSFAATLSFMAAGFAVATVAGWLR